jgi:hypothetical protein
MSEMEAQLALIDGLVKKAARRAGIAEKAARIAQEAPEAEEAMDISGSRPMPLRPRPGPVSPGLPGDGSDEAQLAQIRAMIRAAQTGGPR